VDLRELDELDAENKSKLEVSVGNGNLLMVLVLLENGAEFMKNGWQNLLEDQTRLHHWTPLTVAVNNEDIAPDTRLEIVIFLLTFDQDLNMSDDRYRTEAHWATFRGFPDILQELLVKGADVQTVDDMVESLMGYAINKWPDTPAISIDLVNVLLRNGFDVDTTNTHMNTPLHLAVLASSAEIVVILKRFNANPLLENNDGDTPIDIARTLGNQQLVSLLKSAPQSGG
jgi:ankyrin repeat protein